MTTIQATRRLFDQTPLGPLMQDPAVTEIMVNGPDHIFSESRGVKDAVDRTFESSSQLTWLVDRLLEYSPGARLDASSPFAAVALPDGSRVHLARDPVAPDGPIITIRKYVRVVQSLDDYVARQAMDDRMAAFLDAAVEARLNLLFSGAAGVGKTTLLEVLAKKCNPRDRIVVIEDTQELHLSQPNVVRLVTKQANLEGRGEVRFDELFSNSLRMRPDRILLGELRGEEALAWLQAINSGHKGSMAVLHASTPVEATLRIENLVATSGWSIPREVVRQQVAHGLDVIIQMNHGPDGVRRISRIAEVRHDLDAGRPIVRDLFKHQVTGVDERGNLVGHFTPTGVVPDFANQFTQAGVALHESVFRSAEAPV